MNPIIKYISENNIKNRITEGLETNIFDIYGGNYSGLKEGYQKIDKILKLVVEAKEFNNKFPVDQIDANKFLHKIPVLEERIEKNYFTKLPRTFFKKDLLISSF